VLGSRILRVSESVLNRIASTQGKESGGCELTAKHYPFCGITIDIMDAVCMVCLCISKHFSGFRPKFRV